MDNFTLKKAIAESGKVSLGNTKMPSSTFAIDAFACKVGSKLAKVKGSTCEKCYARKLQKLRPSVNQGWSNNQVKAESLIAQDSNRWSQMLAFQIKKACTKIGVNKHRWFDSGDLASVEMLKAICDTANMTPEIDHWLPTREAMIVKEYRKLYGKEPKNLCIRISATMVGDSPIKNHENTSTVHTKDSAIHGKECLAYRTNIDSKVLSKEAFKTFKALTPQAKKESRIDLGHCGDCRACWNKEVKNISYPLH